MKIVFLDIDGVLTTLSTKWKTFHPDCVKALKRILNETGAFIVLSSSWRHGFIDWRTKLGTFVSEKDSIKVMKELLEDVGIQGDKLIGKTPSPRSDDRGDEIVEWIKGRSGIESFVILDDGDDMGILVGRLVRTDGEFGIDEKDADRAINILTSYTK